MLRTFLEMLGRGIKNDEEARDAAEQDSESDGLVAVMTIHRFKGLEFPVLPGIEQD